MATVIHTPAVKKGMPRELIRHGNDARDQAGDAPPVPDGTAVQAPANVPAATFDLDYVEQLNSERLQALSRVQELEERLQKWQNDGERLHEEARQKGYDAGALTAQTEGAEQFAAQVQSIRTLAENLAHQQQALLQASEDAAVEIAYAALVKILGRSRSDLSLLTAMVKQALQQVSVRDDLVIHVAPADYDKLTRQPAAAKGRGAWPQGVTFEADDSVTCGGCIVKSRAGVLDARLDYQLQQLKKLLVTTRTSAAATAGDPVQEGSPA
ncbi:hypothetical protein FKG94_17055 [Exilibacterium tricleocarpae]|uniref:Flagellar assembly protein FliH n=1 Tax=Exilibacterium tricleocarpae TaxID=2591008 RepID=A0A545T864_9GAMM|nr:FliH/SctL family protein [Exilibacterium tricleocarpae]TQV73412.1 hypothetical protein FKG94_17055 [Exilibacterium tricleocarpae]